MSRRRHLSFGLRILVLAAMGAVIPSAQASTPSGQTYNLVWSDEFNQGVGLGPSSANWSFDLGGGGWGNSELETYVNDLQHCSIVSDASATDGQALQITATASGTTYNSARIKTMGLVQPQYGFVEARIRIPYGQGIWPAFWALGSNSATAKWPACGEMDIMENGGNASWSNKNQASLHGTGYSGGSSIHDLYTLASGAFSDSYHLFQMQWSPYVVRFYIDGTLYSTKTAWDIGSNAWAFNHPFYFIANVAVGGTFAGNPDATTVFPQTMKIDYVRVYQAPSSAISAIPTVSATPNSNQVTLSLSSSGAEYYNIYRSTTPGGEGSTPFATNVTGSSWGDTHVSNGTTYYYRVTSLNYAGESAQSSEVQATPAAGIATAETDTLHDLLTISSKSAGWAIDFSNASYFDGDSARANRTGDTTQYVAYSFANMTYFTAKVYTLNAPITKVTFLSSTDGRTYSAVAVNYGSRVVNSSGWGYYLISPTLALPSGTKSVKIQIASGTGNNWDPQISQVTLNHS